MAENAVSENSIEISPSTDDFGLLCVCAIRSCLGQRTEIPQKVVAFVEKHLPAMSTDTLRVFAKIGGFNKTICFYKYHRHMDVCRAY